MREDYYWYWVNNIVGISNAKLKKLFAVFDTPEEIYKASDRLLESVNDIRMSDIMAIKESRKDDYVCRQYSDLEKQGIQAEIFREEPFAKGDDGPFKVYVMQFTVKKGNRISAVEEIR